MPQTPITIEAYDPAWPEHYEAAKATVLDAVGEDVERVDHVGSTAVPGMAARPIVDVQVVVPDEERAEACIGPLTGAGFAYQADRDGWHVFEATPDDGQSVAVSVHQSDSQRWRDAVLFRDYLRTEPEAARRYESLKRDLAADHPEDPAAYRAGKASFVEAAVAEARERELGPTA